MDDMVRIAATEIALAEESASDSARVDAEIETRAFPHRLREELVEKDF